MGNVERDLKQEKEGPLQRLLAIVYETEGFVVTRKLER